MASTGYEPGIPRTAVDWSWWLSGLNAAVWASQQARDMDVEHRLQRARAFIDASFTGPIDLGDIAERACFSRYHFHRLFRCYYGVTPHEYVTEQRVRRARALLSATELTVTEVCLEVGFRSLGSFSALFRRHVGHAPSRYRRRLIQSGWQAPVAVPWCFVASFGSAGASV